MFSSRRQLLLTVLVAVVAHVALLGIYLRKYDGNPAALVGASFQMAGKPPWEEVPVAIGAGGYDGMFYYAIARDPWVPHREGVDAPALRHVRVLYPLLSWMLSGGGDARLLLWAMPLVNLLAIAGLTWLGAWFACRNGLAAWWGMVLPFALAAFIPAARNLTDNVSSLAICGLLVTWMLNRSWWSVTLAAFAAVFAREQNVCVVGIVMVAAISQRRAAVAAGTGAALLAWGGWVLILQNVYGQSPFDAGPVGLGFPLQGILHAATNLGGPDFSTRLAVINALSLLQIGALLSAGFFIVYREPRSVLAFTLLGAIVLAFLTTQAVWSDLVAYRRVLAWLPIGIWIFGVTHRTTWMLHLLAAASVFSLAVALHYA